MDYGYAMTESCAWETSSTPAESLSQAGAFSAIALDPPGYAL